jgi:molybdopterin/thiamine biosynthesis adenylyltransferase
MDKSDLYHETFIRNIGIFDDAGQRRIGAAKIAIGGLGLGGSIFINLVRLGFQDFHVADPDVYDRTNINRQRLADESTIGIRKDDCLLAAARAINPAVRVTAFPEGVKPDNIDRFLEDREWVVDVVDLFAMSDKLMLNERARAAQLPVASCAAVGFMGVAVIFDNKLTSPSFAELSGISPANTPRENSRRFVRFICPYVPLYMEEQLVRALDPDAAGPGPTHIPFVVVGVEMAAAVAATEIVKHVLGMDGGAVAPNGIFMDAMTMHGGFYEASFAARSFPARPITAHDLLQHPGSDLR